MLLALKNVFADIQIHNTSPASETDDHTDGFFFRIQVYNGRSSGTSNSPTMLWTTMRSRQQLAQFFEWVSMKGVAVPRLPTKEREAGDECALLTRKVRDTQVLRVIYNLGRSIPNLGLRHIVGIQWSS